MLRSSFALLLSTYYLVTVLLCENEYTNPARTLKPKTGYWFQRSYLLLKMLLNCAQKLNFGKIGNSIPAFRSNAGLNFPAVKFCVLYCAPSQKNRSLFNKTSLKIAQRSEPLISVGNNPQGSAFVCKL